MDQKEYSNKHKKGLQYDIEVLFNGADNRNRTCTPKELDPKSSASASSAISACQIIIAEQYDDEKHKLINCLIEC